ncbi:hypothetical protein QNH39_06980 [Neobacillus novalis]|uniref:Uncharacterized protein n=1 Tax=Neobacillus novalis TaxID=220687 RepID=A0AA95SI55_9BACI|nr:hypothetical protein [Neobacillus novalis]WHY87566.1 hypothetical protein QNH39_06980 [Neobacillus novalis]
MNLNLMSVLSGKGFVMYNKELAHKVSVNGAIIFGQLCSSYESFGSKGMLTIRDNKEYFFLTIETLDEETALSYKQQMKAVKDLEDAGYIETRNMGVPQKRHFHITIKIVKELLSSSDKREELNTPPNPDSSPSRSTFNLDQRERLELPKGDDNNCQKVSNIKKKNKKEKIKENNIIDDDKRTSSTEAINPINNELINSIWESVKDDISKRTFNSVLRKVKDKHAQGQVNNFRDYFITALTNKENELELRRAKDKAALEIKKSSIARSDRKILESLYPEQEANRNPVPFYNWLEQ